MQVSAKAPVIGEFDKVSSALIEGPANWMPGMYESPTGKVAQLEANTSLGRLARYALIRVGTAAVVGYDEVVVPLNWHSLEAEAAFPVFEGRLRLSRSRDGTHKLELEGDYEPPGGIVGHAVDAAAMHPVVAATVQDFVDRIAGVLAHNALARSVEEQVRSGRLTLEDEPPGC